ncbi:hypothetical protein [Herbaspirillum sp. SJZ107]|uniref:hypothetical protein n=1 Tax=Herbaspirillum sp. SJZ107 TaxID=2572881 RepID=UPI00114EB511|nr:hypothetical protein [Herbaspirillum sp. SJZ107]TQK03247.1 hypothetical protein FBX97_4811 [Herbaspirillum sp. SJZ107]
MEHESHHHHPHGTGVRWLDVILGVAATIVSLVSLWLGLHSAHSMEKLVAANSYPYLELMRSNMSATPLPGTDRHQYQVKYELVNNGIGPARIEWVELKFKGKPMRNLSELLDACCKGWQGDDVNQMDTRGGIDGSLVRAGGEVAMFTWAEPATSSPVFVALHRQMDQIAYSACYCSVFDECYLRTEDDAKPQPVRQCTAPAVPFQPSFNKS